MDIDDIKSCRARFERDLYEVIEMFEDETGMRVRSIDIDRITTIGAINDHVARIKTQIELP